MDGETVRHCVDALCMCAAVVAFIVAASRN